MLLVKTCIQIMTEKKILCQVFDRQIKEALILL